MKNELMSYLNKIDTKILLAYGVYQIEADGLELFEYVKGDKNRLWVYLLRRSLIILNN